MLPKTTERVARHTARHVNDQISRRTDANVRYFESHPEEIDRRLRELDREWDIERTLETNAAAVALLGTLAASRDRRWLVVPVAVSAFLLQHALQGWCPPLPLFRRLGVRTATEIDRERAALRRARGDFASQ